ncbi:MAG: stress response translation initiation inhibitor YciH [Candidatus Anstonellales archaeon]
MPSVCPKCGLLLDLCVCNVLDKEEVSKIVVYATKKKFKKLVTIVEGIDQNTIEQTAKELKQRLACGGTVKDGLIVLQGNHLNKIKDLLIKLGYLEQNINVKGEI